MRFECAAYGIGHNTGLNCPVKSLDIACAIVRIRKVNVAFRKRLAGYAVHTHNDHLPCHNAVGFQFPVIGCIDVLMLQCPQDCFIVVCVSGNVDEIHRAPGCRR